jgi:2-methylcitrate dehydratase PrpD
LATTLRAIITGYEVGGRMGEALRIRPGMHVDGAWGALAAAASASRMLSGDAAAGATAIRTVACQVPFSLYAPVAAGATARNTYVGHGAALGLMAAVAASAGVTAPVDAIAAYGELALGGPVPELTPAGEYLILEGYLKPFAAVRHVHYGAQCALDWRAAHGSDTGPISGLKLEIYDEAIQYCGNRDPQSAIQAQFSLSWGLAHALVAGDLGPEAYTDAALGDREIRRLESLVEIEVDEALSAAESRGATLTVTAGDMETTTAVTTVAGDPGIPPGEAAVRAKFSRYATPVVGEDLAARIADGVMGAPLDTALSSVLPTR